MRSLISLHNLYIEGVILIFSLYLKDFYCSITWKSLPNSRSTSFIDSESEILRASEIYTDLDTYCNYNTSNNLNGIACAKLAKSDSEYFKKVIKFK